MPGGSISRVLSRIRDHNKSLDRARPSRADDEERAQFEPSTNKRKKSSSSSSSNRKSVGKRGHSSGRSLSRACERPVKRPRERSRSRSSLPAAVVRSTRENTPKWAKYLLLAQKASDVRLEKLGKVVKRHGQKSTDDSLSGHKFEKKLYEEQHDFNLKVLRHLQNVCFVRQ